MTPKPCKYCQSPRHQGWQCYLGPKQLYKPTKKNKPCAHCGGKTHFAWQCSQNPNRKSETKMKLTNGKHAVLWTKTRNEWLTLNPPDHAGYYYCYLCGKAMVTTDMTLDHIKSRSRHPELRYTLDNLAPCCARCNERKGSRDIDKL